MKAAGKATATPKATSKSSNKWGDAAAHLYSYAIPDVHPYSRKLPKLFCECSPVRMLGCVVSEWFIANNSFPVPVCTVSLLYWFHGCCPPSELRYDFGQGWRVLQGYRLQPENWLQTQAFGARNRNVRCVASARITRKLQPQRPVRENERERERERKQRERERQREKERQR